MQRRNLLALFSVFVLVPTLCSAQDLQKKILSGYAREEGSGQVISGVHIELQNSMGTPFAYAFTDGNGEYQFDDMGGGDCYIVAEHKGYQATHEFVRPDGSNHMYKDVFLRPEGAPASPKTVSPVSEHQLSIPHKAQEAFDKGVELVIQKSDYRGAVAQFAKAIDRYPSYYEAYAAMGLAESKMGDTDAAETALRKSIVLSAEKYPQAMIDLASMYNGKKRFTDAEPLLRKAIALDASSWNGQFELAVSLGGQNRFKEAVVSATAARDLKPDNPQIYLMLYNLHIEVDDYTAALADADAYLKLKPTGATADRVRSMQEKLRKDMQNAGNNPGHS